MPSILQGKAETVHVFERASIASSVFNEIALTLQTRSLSTRRCWLFGLGSHRCCSDVAQKRQGHEVIEDDPLSMELVVRSVVEQMTKGIVEGGYLFVILDIVQHSVSSHSTSALGSSLFGDQDGRLVNLGGSARFMFF